MAFVLGIDASTTATKAVLIDESGAVLGTGVAEYGYEVPQPLWSEQDPALWWDGAVAAIRSVLASTAVPASEVAAIGLTGQMHGLVLLDAADRVLRPAILWNDQRTAHACDEIRETIGAERLIRITGNDALTGFTAPKLVWVRDHEPDVWSRIAHVLLPKDYVRLQLTGEHAIDAADGAGTILFDLAARTWSREIVEALRIDPAWLPPVFEGPEVTGRLTAAAAEATGLRAGTPVVAGGGDQSANAVGLGAVDEGTPVLSLGTSGVVFAPTRTPDRRAARPRPCLLPRRARPMAPDVGHALGGREPALVPRHARAGRGVRAADRCRRGRSGRQRRAAVPPLPHGRAEPAPGSAGPRRVRRADRRPRAAAPDPGRARGRGVRAARRARPDDRRRDAGPDHDPRVGRRASPARSGARSSPTSSKPRSRPSRRPRARRTARACWRPSAAPAGSRRLRTRPGPGSARPSPRRRARTRRRTASGTRPTASCTRRWRPTFHRQLRRLETASDRRPRRRGRPIRCGGRPCPRW